MTGPTLRELATDFRQLLESGLSLGEVNPETGEVIDDFGERLAALEGAIERKVDGCGSVLSELEGEALKLKREEDRLAKRRRVLEARIEGLRDYVRHCLETAGVTKVTGTFYEAGLQKPRKKVDVYDVAALPKEFWRQADPVPALDVIAKALKAGEEVPGARLKDGEAPLVVR